MRDVRLRTADGEPKSRNPEFEAIKAGLLALPGTVKPANSPDA
jgi:hypothetical protein